MFLDDLFHNFKEKSVRNLNSPRSEGKKRNFQNTFYKARITLLPKFEKDYIHSPHNSRAYSCLIIDAELLHKQFLKHTIHQRILFIDCRILIQKCNDDSI